MPQYLKPQFFHNDGSWAKVGDTTSALCTDDGIVSGTPDDGTTFIWGARHPNPPANAVWLGLAQGLNPIVGDDPHVLRFRVRRNQVPAKDCLLILRNGHSGSNIILENHSFPALTWTTIVRTLTPSERNAIVSYADLWVIFQVANGQTSLGEQWEVTAVEFEAPDGDVESRFTRSSLDVLAPPPPPAALLTRQALDVLGAHVELTPRFTRQSLDVLARYGSGWTRFTRQSLDVLASSPAVQEYRFTRASLDVLATPPPPPPQVETLITRQAVDVLAARVTQQPIVPLPLPTSVAALFVHNWQVAAEIETSWATDVFVADTDAEERVGLVDRPLRTVTARLSGMRSVGSTRLVQLMLRYASIRSPFPLYPDHSMVTDDTVALDLVPCDTDSRRFFPGARLAVAHMGPGATVESVDFTTIVTVAPGALVVSDFLTLSKGDRAYPMIDADVSLDRSATLVTDEAVELTIKVEEVYGQNTLPATAQSPPPEVPSVSGFPLFLPRVDWMRGVEYGVRRSGERFASGRSTLTHLRGDSPRAYFSFGVQTRSRAEFFELLRLWDSRRGRLYPVGVVHPESLYRALSFGTNRVTVEKVGTLEDAQDFVRLVAYELRDGTVEVRFVTAITNPGGGSNLNIFVVPAWPVPALEDVRRVTTAHLSRFDSDSLLERWATDEATSVEFQTVELNEEKDVEIIST